MNWYNTTVSFMMISELFICSSAKACQFKKPLQLQVFFENVAEIQLTRSPSSRSHGHEDNKLQIVVDGSLVSRVDCPSKFYIRNLQAGMHNISFHSASKSGLAHENTSVSKPPGLKIVLDQYRTFFVAHESFRPGHPWSPPNYQVMGARPYRTPDIDEDKSCNDERSGKSDHYS